MKNFRRVITLLPICTSILLGIASCKSGADNNFRKEFYYSFKGFDSTGSSEKLLLDIKHAFDNSDYMINDQNLFISIPRDTIVSKKFLDFYHPAIHRIQVFSQKGKFEPGDVHIEVINKTSAASSKPIMQFIRYSYTEDQDWKLDFDLGDHHFAGLPYDKPELRLKMISGEIARVSFK